MIYKKNLASQFNIDDIFLYWIFHQYIKAGSVLKKAALDPTPPALPQNGAKLKNGYVGFHYHLLVRPICP